jgi:hypothetical protein
MFSSGEAAIALPPAMIAAVSAAVLVKVFIFVLSDARAFGDNSAFCRSML